MRAWVLSDQPGATHDIVCIELARPEPAAGQVRIRLRAAALNHRDLWCVQGQYPGLRPNTPLGSDGCGVVEACGADVSQDWLGRKVVVNPNIDWGMDPVVQGDDYQILGMPSGGTFAEYICVGLDRLHLAPAYMSVAEAAALPLAMLTAYRALFVRTGLGLPQEGRAVDVRLLVTGIGGGVALMVLQFAVAVGMRTWVTSASARKIEAATSLGALGGFCYTETDWEQQAVSAYEADGGRGFDLIIDAAGGGAMHAYLRLLRPGGRLVIYGATAGLVDQLDLRRLFWKQLTIQGSTMGSDKDFVNALDFVERHQLRPVIDKVYAFEQLPEALARMQVADQFGKLVVEMQVDL